MAPTKVRTGPRNPNLVHGIKKYSRSKMYHKRGLWAMKAKNGEKLSTHQPKAAATQHDATEKAPKFYPVDDVKKGRAKPKKNNPTKLRDSITPGTVLILLAVSAWLPHHCSPPETRAHTLVLTVVEPLARIEKGKGACNARDLLLGFYLYASSYKLLNSDT